MATGNRLAALFTGWVIAFAQNPTPAVAPDTVIRIDVNLVQVDAVVTDSKDRRVTNLKAADFVILQDGKSQPITSFSYVSNKPATPPTHPAAQAKPVKGEPPPPPPVFEPSDVRRAMALVVDDLGLASENIPQVRNAIRSFIDDQMRPGDLVAIVRTSAGMGALQQFTTDKRLLHAALDRVKYVTNRVGMSSFTPLASSGGGGRGGRGRGGDAGFGRYREETMTVGSLGAIEYVLNSMTGLPGRKSLVLFTEDIRVLYQRATDGVIAGALQQVNDAASRAGVVIHTVDPRGMADYSVQAADNTSTMSGRRVGRVAGQRELQTATSQQGMSEVAEESGGLFLQGNNDLAGALREAAEDSDGYYLIGYRPEAGTFEKRDGELQFHKIEVKVKEAGLHVRSRDGFFGEPGGDRPLEHTREAELNRALQSPFSAGPIHPRLTAVYWNLKQGGASIDALLHFDAKELRWSSEPDGSHKATIDIAAAAFDEDGLALAPVDATFPLELKPEEYGEALNKGMVCGLRIPVTKAGPYQVRAAVRDTATEGSGSAEQYVEVPDVANGRLALSGILLKEVAAQPVSTDADLPQSPAPRVDLTDGAAGRRFRRGAVLDYGYQIVNAKTGAGGQPELEAEARLFHDGEQVLASKMPPPTAGSAPDPRNRMASGRLTLGSDLEPGVYVLQVVVTDKLAAGKFGVVTESQDFEIAP